MQKKRLFQVLSAGQALLCCVGILVTGMMLRGMQPRFQDVKYAFGSQSDQELHDGTMPLWFDSTEEKDVTVFATMVLPVVRSSYYVLKADDCLKGMIINGQAVEEDVSTACYWNAGLRINLRKYLQAGENHLRFTVFDNGGKGGVDMRSSWTDPTIGTLGVLLVVLILLFLEAVARLLRLRPSTRWLYRLLWAGLLLRLLLAWHPGHGS